MNDFTVCLGIDCQQRDQCRRYLAAEIIPPRQSVIAKGQPVLTPQGVVCGAFVAISVATEGKP